MENQPNKKLPVSTILAVVIGLLPLFTLIFTAGASWGRSEVIDQKQEEAESRLKEMILEYYEFSIKEVDGGRADSERADKELKEDILELKIWVKEHEH